MQAEDGLDKARDGGVRLPFLLPRPWTLGSSWASGFVIRAGNFVSGAPPPGDAAFGEGPLRVLVEAVAQREGIPPD
jgi:hypothetical protein